MNIGDQLPKYRTWSGLLIIGIMMIVALLLIPSEHRASVAPAVVIGLGALGASMAAKSGYEHKVTAEAAAKAPPPVGEIMAKKVDG